MGKVTWKGWADRCQQCSNPTGPIIKRDGKAVITTTHHFGPFGFGAGGTVSLLA